MPPSKFWPDRVAVPPARSFTGIRPINVLQLREILDRVYFGSVVVDDKGIITFLSQPYAEFLGVNRDEVIGRHVTEVIENTRMHLVVQIGEVEIGKQRIRGEDLIVQRVPIWRFTERTVRSGFVIAWRFATSPTSTSPVLENATTDGVVREPSAFGITTGSPASRTETTELVVPRSIPIILLIESSRN